MSVVFLKHPNAGSLGPAELQVAVNAYESAIKLIGAAAEADGVRESLADHIMRKVLAGERDEHAVRDAAIIALTGVPDRRLIA